MIRKQLATKVLEDNSTLLILEKEPPDSLWAPLVHLISIFAVQPSVDMVDASQTLHRITSQPGVRLIRQIFPAPLAKSRNNQRDDSYTALMILVEVSFRFRLLSENILPIVLRKARKDFVRRRSMTYTMLEASGCKAILVTGNKIINVSLHSEKVPEGITVFKATKGFLSKIVEPFLTLDRVSSRHIHDYPAPDLPVMHRVGTRMDDSSSFVGFPALTTGPLIVCGSSNTEVISVLQQLISSFSEASFPPQIFVIDTQNELNGLISHFQANPPRDLNLQVFRLGTNLHLNLCDVIVPLFPSGKKQEVKASAAWKSQLISQILLSSLHTSEYLTDRYRIPLESQIRSTAKNHHLFTLRDVKLSLGSTNEGDSKENSEGADMMFADMMTMEAIAGILEQLQSFSEVNYPSFTGHYSNTLIREGTITFFQFGAQPSLIRRVTVAFLLHYLSQTMNGGCVVLTHSAEFLGQNPSYKHDRTIVPSSIMGACNAIANQNLLILGSHRLQTMAMSMDTFDEIRNSIYLKMANEQDRDLVINRHELEFKQHTKNKSYNGQKFLGIAEGEGLLFREDAPQNTAFHFKLESDFPIDLKSVSVPETKSRGSKTLGLTPVKYEILMKLLKLLVNQACRADEAMALIETTKHGELSLDYFQSLGLYDAQLDGGVTYWVITQKGRDYYNKQHDFVNSLPVPLTIDEVRLVRQELERLESFYDISSSHSDRRDTNTKIKHLTGALLNYTRYLRATSVPWLRIAEYHDLVMIDSLEWQDFRNLFDLAHAMINNLLLEITQLHKQRSNEEIQRSLQASSIRSSPDKKDLDDFLPDDNFSRLQQISRDLELEPYPKTGIIDIYYSLHTKQRDLFDELTNKTNKTDFESH
ncbi:MAG: hypothetical protein ACXADY_19475 [Candidatus Hodarchaeales archaeon]|jgi:hypothetical protein